MALKEEVEEKSQIDTVVMGILAMEMEMVDNMLDVGASLGRLDVVLYTILENENWTWIEIPMFIVGAWTLI